MGVTRQRLRFDCEGGREAEVGVNTFRDTRNQATKSGHRTQTLARPQGVNPSIGTGVVNLGAASAVLCHQLLYIREGEIQRPNPGFVVPFHGLVSFLSIARDNIQKDTASGSLVGYIVPPAFIFRPPAHSTAHSAYFLIRHSESCHREFRHVRSNRNGDAPCPEAALCGYPRSLPSGSP